MELKIKVGGELGRISIRAWRDVLASTINFLDELDHSGLEGLDRDWVVTGLHEGSLCLYVKPSNLMGEEALPRALDTVRSLQNTPAIPPGATEAALRNVIKIAKYVGHRGITGIEFSDRDDKLNNAFPLTQQVTLNAQHAIKQRSRSISSFRGRLDKINLRGKRPLFSLFDENTRVALRCIGEDRSLFNEIKEGLGKQVSAHGDLSRNALGQPVHMRVDRVRVLDEPTKRLTVSDIAGISPDWTDGLSAVEFVRRQREQPRQSDNSPSE